MDARQAKGLEIAARMRLTYENGIWLVPSQNGGGTYRVVLKKDGNGCTCPQFELTGKDCKHILAAQFVRERDYAGQSLLIDTDTLPERKKYGQVWAAYNEAQTHEKERFQKLLHELCKSVPEVPYRGGRRRTPMADVIFAIAFKVYSLFSSRRFGSDLADAVDGGYLTRPMHPNKVNTHLENPELTPILRQLIARSSLPLRVVETDFAVDSSGFSSSRFDRWYDEKYGCHRSGHAWVKCHIACGTKTQIVTAVEIKDQDAADCPQFAPLVGATAQNFTVDAVSADKAYLSNANLEMVEALGGTAFVPFKTNSAEGEGVWNQMYHYFQYRREEFLQHYHRRSLVETTFSAVKRKFGDAVRSRTDTAMVNEVLCKFLCHNICVVIQEQCELGIEATFWKDEKDAERPVLAMVKPG
jgi:transposase